MTLTHSLRQLNASQPELQGYMFFILLPHFPHRHIQPNVQILFLLTFHCRLYELTQSHDQTLYLYGYVDTVQIYVYTYICSQPKMAFFCLLQCSLNTMKNCCRVIPLLVHPTMFSWPLATALKKHSKNHNSSGYCQRT